MLASTPISAPEKSISSCNNASAMVTTRDWWAVMYVVEFSRRDDGGPMLIGPFGSPAGARRWIHVHGPHDADWQVRSMSVPDHF